MHLPDLIDKLRALVSAQYKIADRALLGIGDLSLRPAHSSSNSQSGLENNVGLPSDVKEIRHCCLSIECN